MSKVITGIVVQGKDNRPVGM